MEVLTGGLLLLLLRAGRLGKSGHLAGLRLSGGEKGGAVVDAIDIYTWGTVRGEDEARGLPLGSAWPSESKKEGTEKTN